MRSQVLAGGSIAIVFGIGGFFIGLSKCVTPEDGNPVGFHLTGEAQVKTSSLDLKQCTSACGVRFDFRLVKQGTTTNAYPAPTCDTGKPCFEFTDVKTMQVGSTDDAMKHNEEPVAVSGVVELTSPNQK
jgi:hypothetical protein